MHGQVRRRNPPQGNGNFTPDGAPQPIRESIGTIRRTKGEGARRKNLRTSSRFLHYLGMEHISDHDLERYYLGMAPNGSPEEEAIEEHLLWCRECLARAAVSERYVDAIRAAIISGNFDLA